MQVYPNRFPQTLGQSLPAITMVFGDEPQQKLDTIEALRKAAVQQGFTEKKSLVADNQFSWNELVDAFQSMSLFAERQYIELELPTGKPGAEGSKTLLSLLEMANPDVILLIHGPKVGKDVQSTKWFKAVDKSGIYVPCYDLSGNQLSQWLQQQLISQGLTSSPDLIALLGNYYEGNLLAAKQEIEKLKLHFPDGAIDLTKVESLLMEQSRYDVFQLVDLVLQGDAKKAVKLLDRLDSEGTEPTIISWALCKEALILKELMLAKQSNQSTETVFKAYRIWQNKKVLYNAALNRLSLIQIQQILEKTAAFDSALKQISIQRPFVELCHLCFLFMPMALDGIQLDYPEHS